MNRKRQSSIKKIGFHLSLVIIKYPIKTGHVIHAPPHCPLCRRA
ncbi:MAG: hypothetical protein ACJ0K4_14115 [Verrucomicrobiales bacterium]